MESVSKTGKKDLLFKKVPPEKEIEQTQKRGGTDVEAQDGRPWAQGASGASLARAERTREKLEEAAAESQLQV